MQTPLPVYLWVVPVANGYFGSVVLVCITMKYSQLLKRGNFGTYLITAVD